MASLHHVINVIVELSIIIFEFIGVIIIIISGIKGVISYMTKNPLTRLNLAKGMAMGLEFKLGSEILRTVIVRDFSEIALVGTIILLRASLAFLIHWEIKNEENHNKEFNSLDVNVLKKDKSK